MSDDGVTVYPDEATKSALKRYQGEQSASKSGAANELIQKGARAHYQSPLSSVYRYLGFGFFILGTVLFALDVGLNSGRLLLFADSFDLYALLAFAIAAVMAYIEISGIRLRSLLRLSSDESDTEVSTSGR